MWESDPSYAKLAFGTVREPTDPAVVKALQNATVPIAADHFGYKRSERVAVDPIVAYLNGAFGASLSNLKHATGGASETALFSAKDVVMTSGGCQSLLLTFKSITGNKQSACAAADEIIYMTPSWFYYDDQIRDAGATPVTVPLHGPGFRLDMANIENAITSRTVGIVINNPHCPTGVLYTSNELRELALVLRRAQLKFHRVIFLISDEGLSFRVLSVSFRSSLPCNVVYRDVVYDDAKYQSPLQFYEHSIMVYAFSKVLELPGQRIGYVALSPLLPPQISTVLAMIMESTNFLGYGWPSASMQFAIPELQALAAKVHSSDGFQRLVRKRELVVKMLTKYEYEFTSPEGTFYVWTKIPKRFDANDESFALEMVNSKHKVIVMPGTVFGDTGRGYVRICLTASVDEVKRCCDALADIATQVDSHALCNSKRILTRTLEKDDPDNKHGERAVLLTLRTMASGPMPGAHVTECKAVQDLYKSKNPVYQLEVQIAAEEERLNGKRDAADAKVDAAEVAAAAAAAAAAEADEKKTASQKKALKKKKKARDAALRTAMEEAEEKEFQAKLKEIDDEEKNESDRRAAIPVVLAIHADGTPLVYQKSNPSEEFIQYARSVLLPPDETTMT